MAQINDFFENPSADFLDVCSKDQLLEIAEHYKVDVGDKRRKIETIRTILIANLKDSEVLSVKDEEGEQQPLPIQKANLSFEQQKELMLIQLEMDRNRHQNEIEVEKMRQKTEQAKINLQREKLELVREGKIDQKLLEGDGDSVSGNNTFDLVGSLRLMPKFNEKDPETFFSLFERLAESRGWPDADRSVMLHVF